MPLAAGWERRYSERVKLLFFIRVIETANRLFGPENSADHRINELLFIRSGKGRLVSQDKSVPLKSGDLLINPEGRLVGADGPLILVQILFSEDLFAPSVHIDREALYVFGIVKIHARKQNLIALSKIGSERMNILLDNMLWEFRNRYRGYSWALRLKLIELLITVMRDTRFKIPVKGLKPFSNTRIQDVILYLHTEYVNPIAVEDVLGTCALGRSQFHALFKAETGQTFTEYLAGVRCDKAAELLVNSDRTILDIAVSCGFNNLSHFYHVFKKKKGASPKKYRGDGK
ncbi:MAG: AraC family transcriptional regulator [Treponemataceae bacterium]